jgi:hypothetical protein
MVVEKVADYGFLVLPFDGAFFVWHRGCCSVIAMVDLSRDLPYLNVKYLYAVNNSWPDVSRPRNQSFDFVEKYHKCGVSDHSLRRFCTIVAFSMYLASIHTCMWSVESKLQCEHFFLLPQYPYPRVSCVDASTCIKMCFYVQCKCSISKCPRICRKTDKYSRFSGLAASIVDHLPQAC